MHPILSQQFGLLQKRLEDLIAYIDNEEQQLLEASAPDGGWSVVQVMTHLAGSENAALQYVRRKIEQKNNPKAGLSAWYRSSLLNFMLKLPLRYKAPKVLQEPDASISYTSAKANWTQIRAAWEPVLDSMKEEDLHKALFKHPIFGKMSIVQTLDFMQTHFNRHEKQMMRTLKALKK